MAEQQLDWDNKGFIDLMEEHGKRAFVEGYLRSNPGASVPRIEQIYEASNTAQKIDKLVNMLGREELA